MKNKLPDWKNKPTIAQLKRDLEISTKLYDENMSNISRWRDAYEVEGTHQPKTKKGFSKAAPKLVRKQAEWRYPGLSEPFLSTEDLFSAVPRTSEDAQAARLNPLILNQQFTNDIDKVALVDQAVRVFYNEGTLIFKVGWIYKTGKRKKPVEKQIPITDPIQLIQAQQAGLPLFTTVIEEVVEEIVEETKPEMSIVDPSEFYIDPHCKGVVANANFMVHAFDSSLSALKSSEKYFHLGKLNIEDIASDSSDDDYGNSIADTSDENFTDEARKKIKIFEYWGYWDIHEEKRVVPIVVTWAGDTIIRMEENPYPDKAFPFIIAPYLPKIRELFGETDAELLSDNQRIYGAITRGIIDTMARAANGQVGMRKGALDELNKRRFNRGLNFEYNPQDDPRNLFHMNTFPEIPQSALTVLDIQNREAESLTGVRSFAQGITGDALGSMLCIKTDIPMIDGSFKKLKDIIDGDIIIGSNGKATTVTKAHEIKPPKIAYNMSFSNNATVKSGGEHLWTVKVEGTNHSLRDWTTMTADKVYNHISKGRTVRIPKMQELHTGYPTNNSINPYVLGYWLGDGNSHSARITTEDKEVLKYFKEVGYLTSKVKDSSKCGNATMYDVTKINGNIQHLESGDFTSNNSLHSELRSMGLHARYGGYKHIPEEYFTASYEEKMELIRGLMDSDGYMHSASFVQFAQSEGQLKDDFIRLLNSLGLKVSIRVKRIETMNKHKLAHVKRTGFKMIWSRKDAYEIGFTPWSNPFKLKRKASKWKEPSYKTIRLNSMVTTEKVLMRCLTVDSIDRLYAVTDKYILTHNTATAVRGAMDSAGKRELAIIRRLANAFIQAGKKIIAMNHVFLPEEIQLRITNEEFENVHRDSLDGKFDLKMSINTTEDKNTKAQELAFMLQTGASSSDPEEVRMIRAEIARLRDMPHLAKKIEEYQPQPDPVEQKLRELEVARLEQEIAQVQAKTLDYQTKAGLNQAKSQEAYAKAEKAQSESDAIDLDFVEAETGTKHERDVDKIREQGNSQLQLANIRNKREVKK